MTQREDDCDDYGTDQQNCLAENSLLRQLLDESQADLAEERQRLGSIENNIDQERQRTTVARSHHIAMLETIDAQRGKIKSLEEMIAHERQVVAGDNQSPDYTASSRQALAEASNHAAALERQLTTERDRCQRANGKLVAEMAARLNDKQQFAEIKAALERQVTVEKEKFVREQRTNLTRSRRF